MMGKRVWRLFGMLGPTGMKGSMVGSRMNGALAAWKVYGMPMYKMYGANENDIMYHTVQWRIQGSPEGRGLPTPEGGANLLVGLIFAENSMKMKKGD